MNIVVAIEERAYSAFKGAGDRGKLAEYFTLAHFVIMSVRLSYRDRPRMRGNEIASPRSSG